MPPRTTYAANALEALVLKEDADIPSNARTRRSAAANIDVEYRIRRADDGRLRWVARRAQFIRDDTGSPVSMSGIVRDITARKRIQEQQAALLALGDRLRDARTIEEAVSEAARVLGRTLEVSRAAYGRIDHTGAKLIVHSTWSHDGTPQTEGEYDLDAFPVTCGKLEAGETLAVADIPSADWLGVDAERYAAAGTVAMIDTPLIQDGQLVGVAIVRQDTPRSWTKDEIDFVHGVADRTYAAVAKLDLEARQHVLNHELGHRMKNQLAMVQAIINQSLRSAPDMETATRTIGERIRVLSDAHDILVSGAIGRTSVQEIIRKTVRLHGDHVANRFHLAGEEVVVASRPALSLALILHELSTNAAKYGALSNNAGFVEIKWRIERNESEPRFILYWNENGGPPVVKPARTGAGSRLIRAGLAGARDSFVNVEYLPEGLACEINADLTGFQAE